MCELYKNQNARYNEKKKRKRKLEPEMPKVFEICNALNTFFHKGWRGGKERKRKYSCTVRTYSKFQVRIHVQYDAVSVAK